MSVSTVSSMWVKSITCPPPSMVSSSPKYMAFINLGITLSNRSYWFPYTFANLKIKQLLPLFFANSLNRFSPIILDLPYIFRNFSQMTLLQVAL